MSCVAFLCIVFGLVSTSIHSVESNSDKKCDFGNPVCTTNLAVKAFKLLTVGVKGLTEPLDPLYITDLNGNVETLNYHITNGTLTGLRNCGIKLLKLNIDNLTFEFHMLCPKLVFGDYYEVTGSLVGIDLNGIGQSTTTADDYLIMVKGEYEKYISEADQKLHFFIKEYRIETDLRGNLLLENRKLEKGNIENMNAVLAYANSNKKIMEEHLRSPILEKYIAIVVKAMNTFLKAIPIDGLFSL